MEFTNEQLDQIWSEGGFVPTTGDSDWEDVNVVEEGDWEVEHKCESSTVIFEYKGKYYRFYLTRWGSYWQGYEYDPIDGYEEVKQVEKTVLVWRAV